MIGFVAGKGRTLYNVKVGEEGVGFRYSMDLEISLTFHTFTSALLVSTLFYIFFGTDSEKFIPQSAVLKRH